MKRGAEKPVEWGCQWGQDCWDGGGSGLGPPGGAEGLCVQGDYGTGIGGIIGTRTPGLGISETPGVVPGRSVGPSPLGWRGSERPLRSSPGSSAGPGTTGLGLRDPPERPEGLTGSGSRIWGSDSLTLGGLKDPRAGLGRAQAAPRPRRAVAMETGAPEVPGPPPAHKPLRGRGQDGGAGGRRDAMAAG